MKDGLPIHDPMIPAQAETRIRPAVIVPFDPRERAVLRARDTILDGRHLRTMKLVLQGLTREEIASQLKISPGAVRVYLSEGASNLGLSGSLNGLVEALRIGIINSSDVVPENFDPSVFHGLSAREKRTVLRIGEGEPYEGYGVPREQIRTRLGANTVEQVIAFYWEAKRRLGEDSETEVDPKEVFGKPKLKTTPKRLEVMAHLAKGKRSRDIKKEVRISSEAVSWRLKQLRGDLKVHTNTGALVQAVELGMIDLDDLIPDGFDPSAFRKITRGQRRVLNIFEKHNWNITLAKAAGELVVAFDSVNVPLNKIRKIVGAKTNEQLVAFILEAKRRGFPLDT